MFAGAALNVTGRTRKSTFRITLAWIRRLSSARGSDTAEPRYRRIHVLLRREGWTINHISERVIRTSPPPHKSSLKRRLGKGA